MSTLLAGLLGAGLAAAVVITAAAGGVAWETAVTLLAVDCVLVLLGIVVIGVRRVDAKVQKALREQRDHASALKTSRSRELGEIDERRQAVAEEVRDAVRGMQGALGAERVELYTRVTELQDGVAALKGQVERLERTMAGVDGHVGAVDGLIRELPEKVRVSAGTAADATYAKLEAHADLRSWVDPRAPLPSLSGWAIRPDVLQIVFETLWRDKPKLIVECGSGSSSVWLGYAVQRLGTGRVVALEHDERFLQASRDLVRAHGLDEVVEVRHAPLEPWTLGDDTYSWYAAGALTDLVEIGVLLVDGPPGDTGPEARYPAVPALLGHCADVVTIVLDDAHRADERALSDRWLAAYPDLVRNARGQGNAAHVFTRRSP
ncbi:class I SAM-dependent methyltransferase [Spirillospora sp. NPDC047279]|uniref:class I SAM-dependent methyltransferase n=1 Tax=Spirillospora sp. NPDC047279 TaxID=3155478 RepID=UPI0033D3C28B